MRLHRPASAGGTDDWPTASVAGDERPAAPTQQQQPGNSVTRLSWIAGIMIIAFTVAFSVVVNGDAPTVRGDADGVGHTSPSSSKDVMRQSNTLAYDVTEIDWASLRSDLRTLVADCQCGPVSSYPSLPWAHGSCSSCVLSFAIHLQILVRLGWHDAGTFNASDGTGGSRAAQRFADGESQDPANAGLAVARDLLQPFKERYRAVGYADLWSLAAVVAIEGMGGPRVGWRAGRRDARSTADSVPHGRLPDGLLGASHLRTVFGRMGFDDHEIVALSGAHTVGRCHADRSGFVGPWTERPLNWDNEYFQLLLECKWQESAAPGTGMAQMSCPDHPDLMMLHTDVALVTDKAFRPYVELYAKSKEDFFKDFAKAYQKLQELGHEGLVTPRHF